MNCSKFFCISLFTLLCSNSFAGNVRSSASQMFNIAVCNDHSPTSNYAVEKLSYTLGNSTAVNLDLDSGKCQNITLNGQQDQHSPYTLLKLQDLELSIRSQAMLSIFGSGTKYSLTNNLLSLEFNAKINPLSNDHAYLIYGSTQIGNSTIAKWTDISGGMVGNIKSIMHNQPSLIICFSDNYNDPSECEATNYPFTGKFINF